MIVYNGKNFNEFGISAIGRGTYGAPARDIEQVHVPGLNGDLLFDSGGFLNATVEYPDCCIDGDFPKNFAALRTFLLSNPGYHRLEDSYATEEFRMAEFRGPLSPDVHTGRGNRSGTFTLSFNCKPQRYLKAGEKEIEIQDWATIKNEWMPSYPIFIVKPGALGSCWIHFDGEGGSAHVETITGNTGSLQVEDSTGNANMIYEVNMLTGVALRYDEQDPYLKYNAASSVKGGIFTIQPGEHTWRIDSSGPAWVKPMWWRI